MKPPIELDEFDYKILRALQRNANWSMAELGQEVGLSHTPCWRRYRRMEAEGIIQGKVVLLDPHKLDLRVIVYIYITIKSHDEDSLTAFESAVQNVEEVVECYSTSGDKDYVLRVLVNDVAQYELLLKRTIAHLPNIASITSTFALKQVKYTTQLPI